MKFLLNFFFPKILLISIFQFSTYGIRYLIKSYFESNLQNPFISMFMMYIGEAISGFIYLYYKYNILEKKKPLQEDNNIFGDFNKFNNLNLKILFMIFCCTVADFFGYFEYDSYYSYKMNQFKYHIYFINGICLSLFILVNEYNNLNIQIYRHHYLGFFLIIFTFPIFFFYLFIVESNYDIFSFILIMIIYLQSKYIESQLYIIEKKLNYEYFISIYYILFFQGIFGIIIMIIIFIFQTIVYQNIEITFKQYNIFSYLRIFLFLILTCIYNLCRLKITEKSRPSNNIIGIFLREMFLHSINSIDNHKIWSIDIILSTIFYLLGALIYCEVITLNFLNLDKYTKKKTINRGISDVMSTINNSNLHIIEENKNVT